MQILLSSGSAELERRKWTRPLRVVVSEISNHYTILLKTNQRVKNFQKFKIGSSFKNVISPEEIHFSDRKIDSEHFQNNYFFVETTLRSGGPPLTPDSLRH